MIQALFSFVVVMSLCSGDVILSVGDAGFAS